MATKTTYTKLNCKVNTDIIPVQFNDQTFGVKKYLPVNKKLELIGDIVELAHNQDPDFANPVKLDIIMTNKIIFAYTDISFTEKQQEDYAKLYDNFICSKLKDKVFEAIGTEELSKVINGVQDTIKSIYDYEHSALGILEILKSNYDGTEMNLENLTSQLKNEDLTMLKEVLNKLG